VFSRSNPAGNVAEQNQWKPQFGSSFSFAGNALWGDGYNQVAGQKNGVLEGYSEWITHALSQVDNAAGRDLAAVYDQLQRSSSGSQEYLNFLFSIDNAIGFTRELNRSSSVKTLVAIHFSAIIYHCAQLMKASNIAPPEIICLSGRGAQSIDIMDRSPNHKGIAALVHAIYEKVYGCSIPNQVTLKVSESPKEATCNDGLRWSSDKATPPQPVVLLGDGSAPAEKKAQPPYSALANNSKVISGVVANVSQFADMLDELSTKVDFRDLFEITTSFSDVATALKDRTTELIDLGLDRHGYKRDQSSPLCETLFFYPLVQNLYELSRSLGINQGGA
jgi:hypothetical protein